jgi:hypothetical protein
VNQERTVAGEASGGGRGGVAISGVGPVVGCAKKKSRLMLLECC